MSRTLAELKTIALSMIAKESLDADFQDHVLAHGLLIEAGPQFVEELGLILTHQRLVLWIQAERRRTRRRTLARRPSGRPKAG